MTRLSIAMATFNGARYLDTQLRSFVEQSRLPDQLVVCDDCSTDETVAILREFARSAPFEVTIVQNSENLGHLANFSKAVALADGDIILMSDQDDRWDADKLVIVEQMFARHPETVLAVNDVRMTDAELNPTGRTLLRQVRASGLIGRENRGYVIGCGTSFRSSLKQLVIPFPLTYGHDQWVNEIASTVGGKRVIERALQDYRRHGGNVSATAMDGARRADPLTILRLSSGKDLTADWQRHLDALGEIERRLILIGRDGYASLGVRRSWEESVAQIRAARAALTRRMRILGRGWAGRKLTAIGMMLRGDYRYLFGGWLSFAKDLIR